MRWPVAAAKLCSATIGVIGRSDRGPVLLSESSRAPTAGETAAKSRMEQSVVIRTLDGSRSGRFPQLKAPSRWCRSACASGSRSGFRTGIDRMLIRGRSNADIHPDSRSRRAEVGRRRAAVGQRQAHRWRQIPRGWRLTASATGLAGSESRPEGAFTRAFRSGLSQAVRPAAADPRRPRRRSVLFGGR
jgi:hypothetical protein